MRPRGLAKWANDDEEAYTHSLCVCVDVCGGDNNCTNIIIYSTPDNIFLRCEWGWTKIECVRMQNDWMTTIMVGTVKSHKCMHHHVVYECAILFHYIYLVMAWANTLHSAIESYKLIFYGIRRVDARPLRFRQYNATHTHTRSRVQIRTRPVDSCTCGVEREANKITWTIGFEVSIGWWLIWIHLFLSSPLAHSIRRQSVESKSNYGGEFSIFLSLNSRRDK